MTKETKIWLVGSGAGMVVGSLLPWVSAGIFTVSGTDGDGVFTLMFGGLVLLAALLGKATKLTSVASFAFGFLSLLIIWNVFSSVAAEVGDGVFTVSPGGGLYVVGLASLGALVSGGKVWADAQASDSNEIPAISEEPLS